MKNTKKRITRLTEFEATYILINNKYINQNYFNDNYRKCEDCGEYFPDNEMTDVGGRHEYYWICETCLDAQYSYCDHCGEYHLNESMVYCDWCDDYLCSACSYTDCKDEKLCEHCYNS